eukprot:499008_1
MSLRFREKTVFEQYSRFKHGTHTFKGFRFHNGYIYWSYNKRIINYFNQYRLNLPLIVFNKRNNKKQYKLINNYIHSQLNQLQYNKLVSITQIHLFSIIYIHKIAFSYNITDHSHQHYWQHLRIIIFVYFNICPLTKTYHYLMMIKTLK